MFHHCKNEEEAKKLYHRLAKRLHPDSGGENDLMILLQENYDIVLNHIKDQASKARVYDARDVKSPQPPVPPPKPDEKVPINDRRLAFVNEVRKILKGLKANSPVIAIIKSLDDNQFLTIQQYEWLKTVWHKATQS